jgi:hypothetical protein
MKSPSRAKRRKDRLPGNRNHRNRRNRRRRCSRRKDPLRRRNSNHHTRHRNHTGNSLRHLTGNHPHSPLDNRMDNRPASRLTNNRSIHSSPTRSRRDNKRLTRSHHNSPVSLRDRLRRSRNSLRALWQCHRSSRPLLNNPSRHPRLLQCPRVRRSSNKRHPLLLSPLLKLRLQPRPSPRP